MRRDVESFEKTCAAVDPEATAAFKALLATEKSPPVAAAAPVTKAQPNDAAPKEQVHKAEPRPQATPKQATTNTQAPATQNVRRDPSESDTQWLDAVRQALVTHQPDHGLSRPPRPARCRNLPHVRRSVTRSRLRRRLPRLPPPQQYPHLPRLRRRHPPLRRLCRRQSPSLRHPRREMRRSPGSRSPGSTRIDPIFRDGCHHGKQDR